MTADRELRLVLPHQLFAEQSGAPGGTVFAIVEHDLLFRQFAFHSHKLVLHRVSIDRFAGRLRESGSEVRVLRSDAQLPSNGQVADLVRELRPTRVTWFDVVDDWLERDLVAALKSSGYAMRREDVLESPNFLTTRGEIDDWFGANPARMQDFYTWQRRRLGILVHGDGQPVGGRWSFDTENRKKLPRDYRPPRVRRFDRPARALVDGMLDLDAAPGTPDEKFDPVVARAIEWVANEFPDAPGDPHAFAWPTTAEEAREHLEEFVADRLAEFGPYEDAISTKHPFISHSLLSAAMNIGLVSPGDVVQEVLDAAGPDTPIASLEGFIRQVIGWREYMRATYRIGGRQLRTSNRMGHRARLGPGWWDATTGLAPVDLVVARVLDNGYCHHIERLMVLGNAMSLLRIDPDEVYRWFMEMFIDAYDWVMVPNVYAMSQFAADDAITTKPYVSGSNYLRKMSDLPPGQWREEWDALYWVFIADHYDVFDGNPRSKMIASLLDGMDPAVLTEHRKRVNRLCSQNSDNQLVRHHRIDDA